MTADATAPLALYALSAVTAVLGTAALVVILRVLCDALCLFHERGISRVRRAVNCHRSAVAARVSIRYGLLSPNEARELLATSAHLARRNHRS